jgi:hypothetical protein
MKPRWVAGTSTNGRPHQGESQRGRSTPQQKPFLRPDPPRPAEKTVEVKTSPNTQPASTNNIQRPRDPRASSDTQSTSVSGDRSRRSRSEIWGPRRRHVRTFRKSTPSPPAQTEAAAHRATHIASTTWCKQRGILYRPTPEHRRSTPRPHWPQLTMILGSGARAHGDAPPVLLRPPRSVHKKDKQHLHAVACHQSARHTKGNNHSSSIVHTQDQAIKQYEACPDVVAAFTNTSLPERASTMLYRPVVIQRCEVLRVDASSYKYPSRLGPAKRSKDLKPARHRTDSPHRHRGTFV